MNQDAPQTGSSGFGAADGVVAFPGRSTKPSASSNVHPDRIRERTVFRFSPRCLIHPRTGRVSPCQVTKRLFPTGVVRGSKPSACATGHPERRREATVIG